MLSMTVLNGMHAQVGVRFPICMPLKAHCSGHKAGVRRRGCVVSASSGGGVGGDPLSPFELMEREFQMQQKEMGEFQKEMDASFSRARESVATQQGSRSDVQIEERRSESGYSYSYRSTTIIGPGFEQQTGQGYGFFNGMNFVLVALLAILSYLFHRGFKSTSFKEGKKWILLPLWPVLVLFNKNFRKQFKSAIRAGIKGMKKQFRDGDKNGTNQGSLDA